MKVTFLGTGTSQGVPIIACTCAVCMSSDPRDKRLRSSVLIESGDETIVIDTGPDFRQQMLRAEVKHLTAVVFTHEHKDHIAGLDDIRAFNFVLKKKIPVYASTRVQGAIKREFAYIFDEFKYPGIPEIELFTIDGPFRIGETELIPLEVMHMRMPVLGFRIGDFCYITDANYISEEVRKQIRGIKVLVLNALRKEPHPSHFTLEQAIEVIDDLKPERAYLTHISHQLGKHADVQKDLPDNVWLAEDGLLLEI